MTSKLKINGIENNKNDIDIDADIEKYVAEKGFVRMRQLVKYLMDNNPNKRGYSKRTIDRKIDQMIKSGILIKIKPVELEKYGIEETDKRALYLTLKNSSEIKDHLDQAFKLLERKDEKVKKSVLDEIELYKKRYVLNPKQLDILVNNLASSDDELINYIIRIIMIHVTEKDKKPNDTGNFIEKLRALLKRYPEPEKPYKNLRTYIIHLLGLYNDPIVIDQLIKDIKNIKNLDIIETDYTSKFTSKIIEEHRSDLFNLINELRRNGKEKEANFINQLRKRALINLGMADDKFANKDEHGEWA